MAAARQRRRLSLVLLFLALLLCAGALDRRFAEYKRCADPECSMLMCRGKAVKDFKGPDCRFVDFKEGESVYVYYKLSGRTSELWAGSVGSDFGYFPKDLLEINHIYTHDELELPTDETDFICFNGGKDDFDNYNVDEILKLSEDITDSDTKDDLETEKEKEIEKATESIYPESDGLEVDSEGSSEDHAEMSEQDNFIFETNKNVEGSLDSKSENRAVNSDTDNPQGDQSAHQPSEDMLQEMLKVPEYESAKNSTISQGEAKQSDYGSKNDGAYTLLHQEVSEDLKTKFGSTADALVSDDETTSLVTSLDGDAEQDLDIDSYDVEDLEEPHKESEEIPLLSFTKEDIKSSEDQEAESMSFDDIFESETNNPEEDTREAPTKLIEKKDNSGLLTHIGDKIFAIVSGGERTTDEDKDDLDEEEEEEEDNEVAVISKKENGDDVLAHSETSSEDGPLTSEHDLITKKVHNVDVSDPKEERHKTQEEEHAKSGMEPPAEKLQSKSMHNFGAFSNYGNGLQSKASIETKEEALKPPLGDIKDDPEGLSFHKIIKDKEREGKKHLEDSLENDTKHEMVWDKLGKTEDEKEKSVNIVSELLEELINESQSDLDDVNVLEGKTKYDTKQHDKDFELKMVLSEKQLNVSAMENEHIEKGIEVAIKESKQESEAQYLDKEEEEGEGEENDHTSSKEILEKRSVMEKSMRATQHGNFTQQNIVHSEDEQSSSDGDMDGEKSPRAEPQSLELDAEDNFLEDPEEELLQDENALNAKMSKERLAAEQSFTSGIESASPQPQMTNDAISRAANPAEEAITKLEQAEREDSMQDLNKENEGMQINEDSQLNEVKESKDEEEKEFMVDEKNKNLDVRDEITSTSLNISELEDKNDDLNNTEEHLLEDFSQTNNFKDKLFPAEGKLQYSHDPSEPVGVSENTDEATEPEYSESVRQLTIMKEFLDVKRVARLQKYLGEQHIFRIESLFHDMELELRLAQKHDNHEDTEKALDEILETSESNVLDIVNNVLDSREIDNKEEVIMEMDLFDEEAALMDDIQELMYSLRQKYSPISESTPLASLPQSEMDSSVPLTANANQVEYDRHAVQNAVESTDQKLPGDTEQKSQEDAVLQMDQPEEDGNTWTETGALDETEDTKVLDSDKRLPHVDTVLGSDDSESAIERDLIADIIHAKDDIVEESSNPSKEDSDAPQITASLDAAVLSVKDTMRPFTDILVSTLPEEMRPGPDFHGLPWEPIIITALVGFATLAILFWRTCLSVKSRMYQVTEKQLVEKIKTLLKEKAEILEKMSEYDQKIKEAKESVKEAQKQNTNLSEEASGLKDMVSGLKETNHLLDDRVRNLHIMLEMEREQNVKKQEQITETQKSLEKLQEVISLHSVELSEVQIALNEAKLSEEKVKSELRRMQEENARLKKSKEQLLQEAEGWSERHTELSEQIKLYQKSQKDIEEALTYKENEIEVLTNCIMQLKQLDADSELEGKRDEANDLANGELSDTRNEKMKNQIKQMMDVSRVKATLSIIEEEKDHLQSKLNDEVAARHELEEQIKKLEHESCSLQTTKSQLENECKTLHQKVEILSELYQQKEMALQKKLTQEEYERQEKEQKLSAADEKAVLAVEEVKIYKQRIQEIEEELQKTERSYKNQIAGHEKKAHENWLLARSAERALAEEKREAANLRQKLIEVNQKIATLQSPLIVKPTAGRPDHQVPPRRGPLSRDGSFGPSPVSGGAPSPPLMMEPQGRPLSANPREGSRGELSAAVVDGPPPPRRHPELSGRMSAPDLGPSVAALINCGPRTSSPSSVQDGMQNPPKQRESPSVAIPPAEATAVNIGPKGPPSLSGTSMTSPATGPLPPPPPPPVRFGLPPHRAPYGPRPLPPLSLVRGAPPLPMPRDYPPGPPFGMRDLPPGPLPPPEQRGYLRGPPPPFRPPPFRDYPPGPRLPPQGLRDYPVPPPARDLPPSGPNDYQGGLPCPPSPASSRDSAHNPEPKP